VDSLARCYLRMERFSEALSYARRLVAPPHDGDASSWQLMAACYKGIDGEIENYVLCLQKSNTLQRYATSTWLELAEAYSALSNEIRRQISSDFESILSNTVTLFRPYFKWKTDGESLNKQITTVSQFLGRDVSIEIFVQSLQKLPWEQHQPLLRLLCQISSCCCLIWARLGTSIHGNTKFNILCEADSCRSIQLVTPNHSQSQLKPKD
jgi:hypothetical protein